ncbi:hypothetical protein PVAP13_9NG430000 [Panicum virgatum]|uniref:CCHC-type domain-containing protein n=1 Tax=Panicum virgatum TaxID=38727 RepID=A0A8T0MNY8_PANVG|nr:hypothetical protein PVAP13_9NG430000 [Panicum virgatum]
MAQRQDLADHLDFSPGLSFQKEVCQRFGRSVHHPSSSPDGSFLLLATFRRYTFWLTEDLVALALQSCLSGTASGFHVKFQSDRHFRFSVSCKDVGFHVYWLRRFIGASFDVYFHLWSNGAPPWEREKLLWEQEQLKEWTFVQSKKQKHARPMEDKPTRRVRFAPKLVHDSPVKLHQPPMQSDFIHFGAFKVPMDTPVNLVFGQLKKDLGSKTDVLHDPESQACSSHHRGFQNSNQSAGNGASRPCGKCLRPGHAARFCRSVWRCRDCFKLGHKATWCRTAAKPKLFWAPKPVKGVAGMSQALGFSTETDDRDSSVTSPVASPFDSSSSPSNSSSATPAGDPPLPTKPEGMHVQHGWARPARARVALGGEPPRRHEEYAIITMEPEPHPQQVAGILEDISEFLQL